MASITLIVQDQPGRKVSLLMSTEPQVAQDQIDFTPAQIIAAAALKAAHEEMDAIKEHQPQIVLVGADGLPH
jgi:hypothetical protein